MFKNEYEDSFLDQDIEIDEELANKLNGKCFIDTDIPERIEGFKFVKTKTGIDLISIGADSFFTYNHVCHEDYGKYKVKDTYFGTEILNVLTEFYLLHEVSEEIFNKMIKIVNAQSEIVNRIEKDFEAKQKQLFLEAKIY